MMRVNETTLDLIKEFEGLRLEAYQDAVGIWTIGYGTTAAAGLGIDPRPGQRITEAEADWYLARGVEKFAAKIRPLIGVNINENEFGACVSLAYNIGPTAFKRSSVLRNLNGFDRKEAANSFLLWNKAGGKVLKGLARRRDAERELFLRPLPPIDAPSAPPAVEVPSQGVWAGLIAAILSIFGGKK